MGLVRKTESTRIGETEDSEQSPDPSPGNRVIVTGLSGWGKSVYVANRLSRVNRSVLWEPWETGFTRNSVKVASYHDLLTLFTKANQAASFRIRYNPPLSDQEKCFALLEHFSRVLFETGQDLTFALDEAQRYRLSQHGDLPRSFYLLMDEGRHKQIQTILVARRPVQLTPLARSLADEVISFRLNSHLDVNALSDYFGDSAEQVTTLPKFHYLHYSADGSNIKECFPVTPF